MSKFDSINTDGLREAARYRSGKGIAANLSYAADAIDDLRARLERAEGLLRRWKLADEAQERGLLDDTEYERLLKERDAYFRGD